jgi:hypothetical protein
MPDGTGGAIVTVHEIVAPTGPLAVVSRCFDSTGRLVSPPVPVTSHFWGHQLPRAVSVGMRRAVVAYTQYENQPTSLYDVSAQRVGCCDVPGDPPPPPPFGCEIVELPSYQPGRYDFQLPCGNRERGFGVTPLSRFVARVPGLRAPSGLATHDAPAPKRATLVFRNVAVGVSISLCTMQGKRVAQAKRPGDYHGMLVLDFAPTSDDLLLVISATGETSRDMRYSFEVASGPGAVPRASRRVAPKRKPKKARR